MRLGLVVLATGFAACSGGTPPPSEVVSRAAYVDPFIATGGLGFSAGSAHPGAVAPQGMAKPGPDTRGPYGTVEFLHFSGYWYGDDHIQGFSHLRLHGAGASDYGVLSVMPIDAFDSSRTTPDGYESPFRKETEVAEPGYYAVTLDRGGIRAEITATERAAHHRWTWPRGTVSAAMILDLDKHLARGEIRDAEVVLAPGEGSLHGRLRSVGRMSGGFGGYDVFFAARTSQPWTAHGTWTAGTPAPGSTQAAGQKVGAFLSFDVADSRPVEVQIGLSFVSAAQAAANLASEMPAFDFERTRARTRAAWESLLGVARIWGGTEAQRRIFYTSLYHAYLMPSVQMDADGSYRGFDGAVRRAEGFRYVSDLSLWDTYRTLHPLYALVTPDRALDAVRSLHEMAKAKGVFPKWPLATGDAGSMIGASAEIVIADAYAKGLTDFDARGVYAILRAAALDPAAPAAGRGGRSAFDLYDPLGYVPASHGGSVSLTTEYAHDDFALAGLARALGEHADAERLLGRSRGYRQLFDPQTGFLRARDAAGSFASPFDPEQWTEDYVEANAWQSLWMAAHDAEGFASLFGGPSRMVEKLEEFFERARAEHEAPRGNDPLAAYLPAVYYWHGNEPDIHAAYLFAQAGRPDLTQKWVRWILENLYGDGPDGLPGNDDGGTLSAWYVLSALGIYPIPGSDRYVLGAPLFPRAVLAVHGGAFTVEAPGVSAENLYVQSVRLNGAPLALPEIRHADLRPGGTLELRMGPAPSAWGRR
jgi:predicted alpha-1,2-mannosidase